MKYLLIHCMSRQYFQSAENLHVGIQASFNEIVTAIGVLGRKLGQRETVCLPNSVSIKRCTTFSRDSKNIGCEV